ncbi:hypothetical protein T4C_5620 [Trichinella pseudospiralis]|uniref:KRAB-A domain-containing protein 2 n=1 Tax=Trichinella pseudospiralis TaxID=6337 RepID=A0A0V1K2V0_TRIPS|nr:hypothetical protein T4C_5620 [Trichinella pseudospiralis]
MDIKQQLNKRLAEILNEKSENSVIYSRATYDKIVNDLLQIQAKGACSAGDHIFKRRFELLIFGEEHRLIRKRKKMRKKKIPRDLVVKLIVISSIMSRLQMDLINYQTMSDEKFNYAMTTYVEYFKRNFINGRPRHPQSQGEIEQLNDRVKEKLAIWMRDNDSDRRFLGLKFNHASVLAQILRDDDSCADGVESDPSKIASGSSCQEMEFFKSDQNKRSMLIQTIEDQRRWN